ncbi:MAG: hypothetical protein JW708_04370, partial [Vallitaleaceae bacterium]|nr:hypothetical protein [Vallitaleaceae bacterium]
VMMIVLLAFGMAALTTSLASYKLSQKNAEFSVRYYVLEEEATRIRYELIRLIDEGMKQVGYEPTEKQEGIIRKEAAMKIYEDLLEYASLHEGMSVEKGFEHFEEFEDRNKSEIAKISYRVVLEEDLGRNLDIKLSLALPEETKTILAEQIVQVENWSQWQEGMGEIEETLFDDPF